MFLSQGLTVVATSVTAIFIARGLEPADWGVFSAFLGVSLALAVVVGFGLGTRLLRDLSRLFVEHSGEAQGQAQRLEATAVTFSGLATVVVVAVGAVAGAAMTHSAVLVLALCALILYGGLFATGNVLEPYLRAQRRLRPVVVAVVAEKVVLVALVIVAVVFSATVWGIALAYVVAGSIRCSVLAAKVFGGSFPGLPTPSEMLALVRKSLPFAFTSAALTIVPRLDALGLLAFSASAAGYFALSDRILGPAVVVPFIGATTLYPFLAPRSHERRTILSFSFGFGACGLCLAAVGFVLVPSIVPLLFGDEYRAAVTPTRVMLLALPFVYASNPLVAYGYSYGRERAVLLGTIGASLIGTCAILVGQATWGVAAAAGGYLLRQVLILTVLGVIAAAVHGDPVDAVDTSPAPAQVL